MAFSRSRHGRTEDGAVEPEIAAGPRLERRRFFKIILSDTLESGKLGIPKSFLRKWGKDLSNSVLLQVPGHSTWTIELEKRNNDMVSLLEGWQEFMKYYSIGHGHLIVFKYKGNSTFCVIIFDKSTSEIDYSLSSSKSLYCGSKFPSPKTEDVIEADDLQDVASRQRMRVERQPSPIYSPRGSEDGIRQSRCKAKRSEPVFGGPTHIEPLSGTESTGKFESEYPFFMVMIQPSYLERHVLYVPRRFIMQHIRKIKEITTLRHLGRSWTVKLKSSKHHRVRFASGWFTFMKEARLRLGNVCVFELIDGDNIMFRVHILNGAGGNKQSKCTARHSEPVCIGPTHLRPLSSPELADEFDRKHPFFKLVIPENQAKKMHVPLGFTRKYIQESTDMVTLRYLDRSWPVKLLRYKLHHRAFFSSGWPAFARENCLRVGDVCMFELIDRDDFVFKVSIFRNADGMEQPTCRASCSEPDLHGSTIPRSLRSPELTSDIDTVHPFFKLVIRQSYASCLGVPVGFAKQHLQEDKHSATLWYSDRSWPVKLIRLHGRARGTPRTFFSAGWRAFARATHVLAGNVCMFSLFDRDHTVFKVSILRGADNDTIRVD